MAIWLVRAGPHGEREDFAIENNVAAIGWEELPDLAEITSRDDLQNLFFDTYPDAKRRTITNWVGQVWAFLRRIQPDDLIVLPLKSRPAIAVGRVTGPYRFEPSFPADARHTRPVEWITTDLPRTALQQDILYSLGAFLTVCQIQRNNAEERIRAVVEGRKPEAATPPTNTGSDEEIPEPEDAPLNLEEFAREQIQTHISQNFRGHEFTRLVTAILDAQGYRTEMAPPGPDAGVDIIAGQGPMGFDSPRLVVQVKSGEQRLDVSTLRELHGVMSKFGAQQGLLVSWGGFKETVRREARPLYFQIRLWDARDVVNALLQHYDRLPEDLRTELPLKRVWTLVLEE